MADVIDQANDLVELHLNAALENARASGSENLTGRCHWCGDPAHGIVCSRECREDMNKAERMRG